MTVVRVNLKGVETGFGPVPQGAYAVKVDKIEDAKGGWKWWLKITAGKFTNRILWVNTNWLPQSLWVIKALLSALDAELETDENGFIDLNQDDYLGGELIVFVGIKQSDGYAPQNVVKKFYPMSDEGITIFPDRSAPDNPAPVTNQAQFSEPTTTATAKTDDLPF